MPLNLLSYVYKSYGSNLTIPSPIPLNNNIILLSDKLCLIGSALASPKKKIAQSSKNTLLSTVGNYPRVTASSCRKPQGRVRH